MTILRRATSPQEAAAVPRKPQQGFDDPKHGLSLSSQRSSALISLVRNDALFAHEGQDGLAIPLHLHPSDWENGLKPVGFIRQTLGEAIVAAMAYNTSYKGSGTTPGYPLLIFHSDSALENAQKLDVAKACWIVPVEILQQGFDAITHHMKRLAQLCEKVYSKRKITDTDHEELMDVYGDPRSQYFLSLLPIPQLRSTINNAVFAFPRHCITSIKAGHYSVSAIAYEKHEGEFMRWMGKRARDKRSYPGLLDVTISGGLISGLTPFQGICKEALEEAGFHSARLKDAKSVDTHVACGKKGDPKKLTLEGSFAFKGKSKGES